MWFFPDPEVFEYTLWRIFPHDVRPGISISWKFVPSLWIKYIVLCCLVLFEENRGSLQSFEISGLDVPSFEVFSHQVSGKYLVEGVFYYVWYFFSASAIAAPHVETVMFVFSIVFIGDGNDILYLFEKVKHICVISMRLFLHRS